MKCNEVFNLTVIIDLGDVVLYLVHVYSEQCCHHAQLSLNHLINFFLNSELIPYNGKMEWSSTCAENIFSYIMKLEYYTIQVSDSRVLLQDYTIITQIVGNTSAYHRITATLS